MWRNYFAAAIRNLTRNKLYTAINMVGLAVGFCAALLIALFVYDELHYDRWLADYQRIYRVSLSWETAQRSRAAVATSGSKIAGWLALDFPEIQAATRLSSTPRGLRSATAEANETVYWSDPNVFDVLAFPVVAGDLAHALSRPDGVVLTRSKARKYFGRDDPIGATIELDRRVPLRVMAVIEDLPSNTHLDTEVFISSRNSNSIFNMDRTPQNSFGIMAHTYIKLRPGASIERLRSHTADFLRRHMSQSARSSLTLTFDPVWKIHLLPTERTSMKRGANPATLRTLSAVGLLVLLIAAFNFVNLMTARSTRRALEVGMRKATGATRYDLVRQFIGESLLYALSGMLLAIALTEALLPSFGAYLDRQIVLRYNDPLLICAIPLAALLVGTLAGVYPALVLSAFRPVQVLKTGLFKNKRSGKLREILVTLQFAILIVLFIAVGVIFHQIAYVTDHALRLDKDEVLLVDSDCGTAFKDEVRKLPGVIAAACSDGTPTTPDVRGLQITADTGESVFVSNASVEAGLLEVYGLKPVAGRFFSRERQADSSGSGQTPLPIVINETAARRLGFASPASAVGRILNAKEIPQVEIIGVVPDFMADSAEQPIQPAIFSSPSATMFMLMSIKLKGQHIPETLRAIDRLWDELGDTPLKIKRRFFDEYLQELYASIRQQAQLLAFFSIVATLIASLGLLGVATFIAEQRIREIGVRKAIGADRGTVVRMLAWQFTRPVLWANAIAWPVSYYLMYRWLQTFAYRTPLQAWMFMAAGALTLTIALLTVSLQAWRAASMRPVTALRYE